MVRITNWFVRHRKHKKYLKAAKGFRLGRKNVYKQVRNALVKQGQNAYIWRKTRKRNFRRLWIERLSAVIRTKWSKYSVFINNATTKNIVLNRKVLSNIAVMFPEVFDKIYNIVLDIKK
jgi:large subunit ribosomal protein L20